MQNILQLVLSPQKGWEDIARSSVVPKQLRDRSVYPLMALAAVTAPMQLLYHHELVWIEVLLRGLAILVAMFAGFFISNYSNDIFLQQYVGTEPDAERCQVMTCYAYGMLALSILLCNFLPVTVGLPVILPIGVGLILWKSENYLGIAPEHDMKFSIYVFLAIILPPLLLRFILGWIIGDWHPESTALL